MKPTAKTPSPTLEEQVVASMHAAESSLDAWQKRIKDDKNKNVLHKYAFPDLIKLLIVEQ